MLHLKTGSVRLIIAGLVALSLLTVGLAPSFAQTNPLPAPTGANSDASDKPLGIDDAIAQLLAANPKCAELSNSCQICIRVDAGDVACSTPGVACTRAKWSCTKIQPGGAIEPREKNPAR